ncbi:MAG: hypothetical protein D6725_15215 [Planctomycetota bacterium]|nr:MAG: hypothetical protein D6725_15215 [Planctomycetota bacterium]
MSNGKDDRHRRARGKRVPRAKSSRQRAPSGGKPRSPAGAHSPDAPVPSESRSRASGSGGAAGDTTRGTRALADTSVNKATSDPISVFDALRSRYGWNFDQPLGDGGFGYVYAIRIGGIDRAVKISKRRIADEEDHVNRELQALKDTQGHPRLLHLVQFGVVAGHLVTVWERADGTLEDKLREHQHLTRQPGLPLKQVIRWIREAAEAIDFLNQRGIYHRDIKPQNLFLVHGHVKVGDMGLVKFGGLTTTSQSFSGTIGYLPPEAWERKRHRTIDIFALAASYVRLRTGRHPFGDTPTEIMQRTRAGAFERTGLSRAEIACLAKALSPDPAERPESAEQWVRMLVAELKRERTGWLARLGSAMRNGLQRLGRSLVRAASDDRTTSAGTPAADPTAPTLLYGPDGQAPSPPHHGGLPSPPAPPAATPPQYAEAGPPAGREPPPAHPAPLPQAGPPPMGPPPMRPPHQPPWDSGARWNPPRPRRRLRLGALLRGVLLLALAAGVVGGGYYYFVNTPLPLVFPAPPAPARPQLSSTARSMNVPITCARFSPDGRRVVTGAMDGTVSLWDARTGNRIAALKGHTDAVNHLACFPQGDRILSVSADKTALVFDAETYEVKQRFDAHKRAVLWGSVSPDGQRVATVGQEGALYVWDSRTGEILQHVHLTKRARDHDATESFGSGADFERPLLPEPHFVAFDEVGTRLVVLGGTGGVVLDAETGNVRTRLQGVDRPRQITSACFLDNGTVIGFDDQGSVIRWNVRTGAVETFLESTLRKNGGMLNFASLGPERRFVAACFDEAADSGEVCVWDLRTEAIYRVFGPTYPKEVWNFMRAEISPDGKYLVAVRKDAYAFEASAVLYDFGSGREIVAWRQFEGDGWLALTPQGFYTGSAEADDYVEHLDAEGNTLPKATCKTYDRADVVRRLIARPGALPLPQ